MRRHPTRWRRACSDAPRCGAVMFTPEVICQIIATLACENPETLDVPDQSLEPKRTGPTVGGPRHHRQKHLARLCRAVFKKKEADLKPHRSRYWLTPKPDPEFDTKCADVLRGVSGRLPHAETEN